MGHLAHEKYHKNSIEPTQNLLLFEKFDVKSVQIVFFKTSLGSDFEMALTSDQRYKLLINPE